MLIRYLTLRYSLWNYWMLRKASKGSSTKVRGPLWVSQKGEFVIGHNVTINSDHRANPVGAACKTQFIVKSGARLQLGNNVGISNASFFCVQAITIEDHVLIGNGCMLWDTDFHPINHSERMAHPNSGYKSKPIVIRQGAFIGASTIILKGVEIGERSVVGAGSVVTRSIGPDELWAGNPAVFIRKINA
jgi:acetyltransferase-like isoleucine patch superfamily enzyme